MGATRRAHRLAVERRHAGFPAGVVHGVRLAGRHARECTARRSGSRERRGPRRRPSTSGTTSGSPAPCRTVRAGSARPRHPHPPQSGLSDDGNGTADSAAVRRGRCRRVHRGAADAARCARRCICPTMSAATTRGSGSRSGSASGTARHRAMGARGKGVGVVRRTRGNALSRAKTGPVSRSGGHCIPIIGARATQPKPARRRSIRVRASRRRRGLQRDPAGEHRVASSCRDDSASRCTRRARFHTSRRWSTGSGDFERR